MRKFEFKKLVRDNIIKAMQNDPGQKTTWHKLDSKEFIVELIRKLLEEASELRVASSEEILGELADIQEIINTILEELEISREQLETEMERKRQKAGGFKERAFVEFNEVNPDNQAVIDIYLRQPGKYPEIK
ncbi:MAG: nucleoside triphosphate pyrophosphohydrolase [Candidatus Dojkabacteria bacterium]